MTETDKPLHGIILDVVKVNQRAIVCAVSRCDQLAVYDIHLAFPENSAIPGVTVPMCRRHGDLAHPGPAEETS